MRTFMRLGGRRPRPRAMLGAAAAFALAAAGIAIAGPGPASTTAVTATLSATQVAKRNIQTCTGTNSDQYQIADLTLTGTASGGSDANLNGQLTIHVRSVYDQTANLGWLKGDVRIDNGAASPPLQFHGHVQGVDANGQVQALLTGNEHGGGHLIGSLAGAFAFNPTTIDFNNVTGFTGAIGGGSGPNTAIVTSGSCKPVHPPKPPKPPHPNKPHKHGKKHDEH